MKVDRELLFKLYMKEVNEICDECDWVTNFGPKEIVNIIATLIENNPKVTYYIEETSYSLGYDQGAMDYEEEIGF